MTRIMRGLLALLALLAAARADGAPEIAVAMRYLLAKGVSHSQIYLYREDGTLLRQLTKETTGQVMNPVFASDGATIVFTQEVGTSGTEYWSVEPKGTGLHRLDAEPDWYKAAKPSAFFTNDEPEASGTAVAAESGTEAAETTGSDGAFAPAGPGRFTTPDGAQEIIYQVRGEDDGIDGPGRGKHYILKDMKAGTEVEMGTLPGFEGLYELLHVRGDLGQRFLIQGAMRIAFFDLHLNSTDGDTVYALELSKPRLVRLSPNWAMPVPITGESAFLTYTENRYVPISGSTMTANCSCIERWDSRLTKVRYAKAAAGICYGASLYRPGGVTVISNDD